MTMQIAAEDWIAHHARNAPDKEALHDLASNRRLSYAQFNARISRAASYFQNTLGVRKGARIAVLCHNDADVFEIQFACRRIGAIFLPLNWRLAVPELEYICNDARPTVLALWYRIRNRVQGDREAQRDHPLRKPQQRRTERL